MKSELLIAALLLTACSTKPVNASAESAAPQATEASATNDADAVIELNNATTIDPVPGKLVVVDFNADWCGPCRKFSPAFHAVARQYASQAVFYSVNVDNNRELAAHFGVQSIPMVFYIFPDGSGVYTTGYMTQEDFAQIVAEQLKKVE